MWPLTRWAAPGRCRGPLLRREAAAPKCREQAARPIQDRPASPQGSGHQHRGLGAPQMRRRAVRIAAGRDTAANIHGARLKIIPGMGHDFPPALMAGIAVMIAEHCRSDHG